jgi:hypothetical protein
MLDQALRSAEARCALEKLDLGIDASLRRTALSCAPPALLWNVSSNSANFAILSFRSRILKRI